MIATQNIRMRTAKEIVERGKPQTVENICNKLNLKLGGINHSINK